MPIDIDLLTEAELIDLNRRVVARLKLLQEMRSLSQMMALSVGDRVSFNPPGHGELSGVIVKCNRRTVTVLTDDRQQWNVAPSLLAKMLDPRHGSVDDSRATRLPRNKRT